MPFGFGIGLISTDQIADGSITNVKVNAAAAIADTKLASPVGTHAAANVSTTVHPNAVRSLRFSFVGNGTQNRAVAHGAGKKPIGYHQLTTDGTARILQFWMDGMGAVFCDISGTYGIPVTEPDATNIYFGKAIDWHGNLAGVTYWVEVLF